MALCVYTGAKLRREARFTASTRLILRESTWGGGGAKDVAEIRASENRGLKRGCWRISSQSTLSKHPLKSRTILVSSTSEKESFLLDSR